LAAVYSTTNEYDRALEQVLHTRAFWNLDELPALAARLHWVEGLVKVRRGMLLEALTDFQKASSIFLSLREFESAGAAQALEAEVLTKLGRNQEAWKARFEATYTLGSRPNRYLHNLLLVMAAEAETEGLPHAALFLHSTGIDVATAIGSPTRRAEGLIWRARILAELDRAEAAAGDLDLAEEILASVNDAQLRYRLEAELAEARGLGLVTSQPAKALTELSTAAASFESIGLRVRLPYNHRLQAKVWLALGNPQEARRELESAVELLETEGLRLEATLLKFDHFERAQEAFDELIRLELEAGLEEQAFETTQRARRWSLAALNSPQTWQNDQQISEVREFLNRSNGILLELVVLPDSLVAWKIDREGLSTHSIKIPREEVQQRVRHLEAAVSASSVSGYSDRDQQLREAFEMLLAPLVDVTVGTPRPLVIVPDRFLSKVPFAALINPRTGRGLMEDFALSLAPSVGSLGAAVVADKPEATLLVGVPSSRGLPELPDAEAEIRELMPLHRDALVLIGEEVDATTLAGHLNQASLFHFAGHALNDQEDPWNSYLALAGSEQAERLEARTLAGLDLTNLRLAVLSGCDTAAGRDHRLLAMSGLTFALLQAGTDAVAANLWPVEDEASRRFLAMFHRHLADGKPPAEALRRVVLDAQLAEHAVPMSTWASLVIWSSSPW
jgi:CHAT domain-containing protein